MNIIGGIKMDIKDFTSSAKDLSRNPLGIIGLFLVLVYGFAGLVTASNTLDKDQKQILVYFLVLFPLVVLYVFYKLVTEHYNKLYSPSDYSNEDNFMKALEIGINKSSKIVNLEAFTEEINKKISEQPLYRYTELEEEGKQLVLMVNRGSVKVDDFAAERKFSLDKLNQQIEIILNDYKWIKFVNGNIEITNKGKNDIKTFEDFVYSRFA